MVTEPAALPRLLFRVHSRRVASLPVGRVCRYRPAELHTATPRIAGGSAASGPGAALKLLAAMVCTAASSPAAVAIVADALPIDSVLQSAASGCAPKALV